MIILDKPYVSELLEKTILEKNYPVLKTDSISNLGLSPDLNHWDTATAVKNIKADSNTLIYSNSENSINWIFNNLGFTSLPEKISLFKDKVKFRKLLSDIYPEFFYQEVNFSEIDRIDISTIKKPFIIKPAIGFFSMGVYFVKNEEEWPGIVNSIKSDIEKVKELYPVEVMDSSRFIIEECIAGDEYAIDVYYDKSGSPVILNILKHLFASEKDVSDRIYYTSKDVIEENLDRFTELMAKIGQISDLKNFPMHIEVRVDENGKIVPIEINPMRFAGWCTTDLAYYAYGINVYEYYFEQKKPDWNSILANKSDKPFYFAIGDVPANIDVRDIADVDYNEFLKNFKKPLEFRKITSREYPVFAFVFAETQDFNEMTNILKTDFTKYFRFE